MRALYALSVPLGALLAAYLAVPRLAETPALLAELRAYAPHAAIAAGLALSLSFGRGRTFFALATIALAYAGLRESPRTPLYHAITFALPLGLAAFAWRREVGAFSRQGLRYGAAVAGAAASLAALCAMFPAPLAAMLTTAVFAGPAFSPLGQPAIGAATVGALLACAAWVHRREAAALALGAAIIAFALAAHAVSDPATASLFIATGALVLAIAVLQDIFQMAFRDPLTGLMSRRALDEHLAALGPRYAIAMIDVDHFKRVNDTYGHDTGDQVLKLIALKLARARSRARAYRYGGEEFALLFAGQDSSAVWEELEALREEIAEYPFRLRAAGRRKSGRRRRNGKPGAARALKVTVSIGVAHADARNAKAHDVLAAADKALYRAKHRGRNTVAR